MKDDHSFTSEAHEEKKEEKLYPPTLPQHIGFPPMPESFLHESADELANPLPENATLEEKQEAYYNEIRAYARELLRGAARNAVLTLPTYEATTMLREVMAETLEEADMTAPGAAIASGHSEATHKRIRAQEPVPSNHLLTTIMTALNETPAMGASLDELSMKVNRRHPDVNMHRLREILPRYCQKKFLDFKEGRYYIKSTSVSERAVVRNLRAAIPSIYQIMEGVMALKPHFHVGHVRLKGTVAELLELKRVVLEAIQGWGAKLVRTPGDEHEPRHDMIFLSGEIVEPQNSSAKAQAKQV